MGDIVRRIIDTPISSQRKKRGTFKTCACCGQPQGQENYCITKSFLFPEGVFPFCNDCLAKLIKENDGDWNLIDKLCQYADIPFLPQEWHKFYESNQEYGFPLYAQVFQQAAYESLDWKEYYEYYKALKDNNQIEAELPLISDARREKLMKKWGRLYPDEDFEYLENLMNGLLNTQNVNGALQQDQAEKLCKISLEIDKRIQEGKDFDKLLSSYDKLVKVAEFTPKNVKNINDLDSVGELYKWLEKRGYKCQFYNDVPKDVVDETMLNIESWNQRLYINESGIGEEISRRIEALKAANELENRYDFDEVTDDMLDHYEVNGFDQLMKGDEEFQLEVDE